MGFNSGFKGLKWGRSKFYFRKCDHGQLCSRSDERNTPNKQTSIALWYKWTGVKDDFVLQENALQLKFCYVPWNWISVLANFKRKSVKGSQNIDGAVNLITAPV